MDERKSNFWQRMALIGAAMTIAAINAANAFAVEHHQQDGVVTMITPAEANALLKRLVAEALTQNPAVLAAQHRARAAAKVPIQVSTLPDPELTLQEFTVGGPRPLEGYTTSDFYYTGFGVAQEIPGPGKLRQRAAIAEREADAQHYSAQAVARRVSAEVRRTFYELSYLAKSLGILRETRAALTQAADVATERYRAGLTPQQDVTRAQLQMTAVLGEIEMKGEELEHHQAELKSMLGRPIDSPDIAIGEVEPSPFALSETRVQEIAASTAPEIRSAHAMDQRGDESLKLARLGYLPDFSLGYMLQVTGPGQRNYYALTLGAKVPLYFWRKQTPAVEQAALEKEAARNELHARNLEVSSQTHHQWISVRTAQRLIAIYQEGLIPQARATRDSAIVAYATGRVDFQTLLNALTDVLRVNQEYYRTVVDREIALAKLRQIIGDQS
ncbi:MAG: TolC family protein [Candidatus Binataceae bacterium]